MIEGDDFHSEENRSRMRSGLPLRDSDRETWLSSLGDELARQKDGAVLTCSALKRTYRERLRSASPGLAFVFLDITPDEAARRLDRRSEHFFPPQLLQSQFETLESPVNEPGVLRLDAGLPIEILAGQSAEWLRETWRREPWGRDA
jgi:gluconokinase